VCESCGFPHNNWLLASVDGGTTKLLMEIAPDDQRISWNLITDGE
jgi:hypothetical protein